MPTLTPTTHLPPLPPRPIDAHKGTFGTVIVVGGCETMIGAPALCAAAALRGGAGLVKIAAPRSVLPAALTIEPGATGIVISDDILHTLEHINAIDPKHQAILALGPGMGQGEQARELVASLLRGKRMTVLDADGLNLLARALPDKPTVRAPLVLTPHPGEFRRLAQPLNIAHDPTDPARRGDAAAAMARIFDAIVVLKGAATVVSDGTRLFTNTTGNPALATAGSGDVLTGLIAALIAQGMSRFDAACLGVHLHGSAADLWAGVHGISGLPARDLAALLPDACHHLRQGPA